mmetsp:Transcript_36851/g.118587  ORF Transcript_36851/g.118587 Transcript_36851/m.118587 type:complete len:254 (-) Transcript_36851:304-1065(-)
MPQENSYIENFIALAADEPSSRRCSLCAASRMRSYSACTRLDPAAPSASVILLVSIALFFAHFSFSVGASGVGLLAIVLVPSQGAAMHAAKLTITVTVAGAWAAPVVSRGRWAVPPLRWTRSKAVRSEARSQKASGREARLGDTAAASRCGMVTACFAAGKRDARNPCEARPLCDMGKGKAASRLSSSNGGQVSRQAWRALRGCGSMVARAGAGGWAGARLAVAQTHSVVWAAPQPQARAGRQRPQARVIRPQ